MKPSRSRGSLENEFSKAIIRFEKEHLGRGPVEARTYFIEDMILVRLRGILTPAEQKLAESPDGQRLVKETRRQLFETSRAFIEDIVREVCDREVLSLHTDMSTRSGERVIVLTVDKRFSD